MPGYNAYNVPTYTYGYQPGNQWQYQPNASGNYALGVGYQPPQNQPQQQANDHYVYTDYVSGRAGADAYQMPPNVNKVWLFDNYVFSECEIFSMFHDFSPFCLK